MAGFLPKLPNEFHPIPYAEVAIIASLWHRGCVEAMVDRATLELTRLQVAKDSIKVHWLPGALELPYAAQTLFAADSRLNAILAFGVVLQGQTTHDASVIQTVVSGFSTISQRYAKPIINEVIGVNAIDDARARADDSVANKGVEAVFALSELLHWQRSLHINEQA